MTSSRLLHYFKRLPDYSFAKFCYFNPKATRIERRRKLKEFLDKTRNHKHNK